MGTENSALWSLLGTTTGRTESLAGWTKRFGPHAKALRRFLVPTGRPAEFYPHPNGGLDLAIEPTVTGSFRAVCTETGAEDWVPPIRLSFEEAQGHTFDLKELAGELCGVCGITPDWKSEGDGLYRLGVRESKSVFLYLNGGIDANERLAAHLAAAGANIDLYVAQRTAEVETCAMLTDVEIAEIGEHLDIGKAGRFITVERKTGTSAEHARASCFAGTGLNVVKAGCVLEFGTKTYSFKGEKRWEVVMKLNEAKGKYVFLGKGVKALFASNEQAKAFFDSAVEAEGQGINGTGRYRLKI